MNESLWGGVYNMEGPVSDKPCRPTILRSNGGPALSMIPVCERPCCKIVWDALVAAISDRDEGYNIPSVFRFQIGISSSNGIGSEFPVSEANNLRSQHFGS